MKMERGNKCCHEISFVLTIVSIILQVVCLTAPGWSVQIQGVVESYRGIFYITKCQADVNCETKTMLEIYNINSNAVGDKSRQALNVEQTYNTRIVEQIVTIFVFAVTVTSLILQWIILRNRGGTRNRLLATVISCCCMAVTGGMMVRSLVDYYVYIDYRLKYYKIDQSTFILFPYCVFMYTLAAIVNICVLVINVFNIRKLLSLQATADTPADLQLPELKHDVYVAK